MSEPKREIPVRVLNNVLAVLEAAMKPGARTLRERQDAGSALGQLSAWMEEEEAAK